MQQLRLVFIARQFFTRLPIPSWVGFQASWLQTRRGGYTGDCLVAVQQLVEVFIHIGVLATLGHGAWS